MTYTLNGQTFYGFEDLVARSGYYLARRTFADISGESGRLINTETGEVSFTDPFPIGEGCLFDEVGWGDLCSHADEIARRNPGSRHLGDDLYELRRAAQSWGSSDESPSD